MNKLHSALTLEKLKLNVYLGATATERAKKQDVLLNLTITFPKLPRACSTDNLPDTICYQIITDKIRLFCKDKRFNLIEHLTSQLFTFIKNMLPKNYIITVTIIKQPPIPGLKSSSFTIEDY
jgi:FolB domain-containing protein